MQPVGKQLCHVISLIAKKNVADELCSSSQIDSHWYQHLGCLFAFTLQMAFICYQSLSGSLCEGDWAFLWRQVTSHQMTQAVTLQSKVEVVALSTSWSYGHLNYLQLVIKCNKNMQCKYKATKDFFSVCNMVAILFLQWLSRAQLSSHIECSFWFF